MKKFKFKLQGILKLKEIEEKGKLTELAKVVGEINRWQSESDQFLLQSEKFLKAESQKIRQGQSSFRDMQLTREYFSFLGRKKDLALKKIEELQPALLKQQAKYNEARKEKKKYEILKEKRYKDYLYEVDKEEQKFIDELSQRKLRG